MRSSGQDSRTGLAMKEQLTALSFMTRRAGNILQWLKEFPESSATRLLFDINTKYLVPKAYQWHERGISICILWMLIS